MIRFSFICCFALLFFGPLVAQRPDSSFLMDNIYKVKLGEKTLWGFYERETGEIISPAAYDSIKYQFRLEQDLRYYEILKNGKWGLLHKDLSAWIPPKYDKVNYRYKLDPARIFVETEGKYGIFNEDGSEWLAPIYDEIMFDGSYFKVLQGDKWGILTIHGEEYIPICFAHIYDNLAPKYSLVRQEDKQLWSVYNWLAQNGNPCELQPELSFERIEYFNEFFTVYKDGLWGVADDKGQLVIDRKYKELEPFSFLPLRWLKVLENDKYGLLRLDSLGNLDTILAPIYDDIGVDPDNYKLMARYKGKEDYMYEGEGYFNFAYDGIKYFLRHQLFIIELNGKAGVANVEKDILIPPKKYNKLHIIDRNTFMVQKGGKWGVVDAQNRELIAPAFTNFDFRKEGYFFAADGEKWGVVSLKKGILLPPKYEDVVILPKGRFLVQKGGKWGVVAVGGRIIEPIKWETYRYTRDSPEIELLKGNKSFKYKL